MTEPSAAAAETTAALRELALDLRWTWSHEADALWMQIDAQLWEQSHSPWTLLQNLGPERADELARDADFTARLQALLAMRRAYAEQATWYATACEPSALKGVAYFSMEFGLGAALPLYAGGLGVLAGDFLKAASDLGVPVAGVGLLYQEGYFRQVLDTSGGQREVYPFNDPAGLPIAPAMADGDRLRVSIALPGRNLHLRVWRARVGRVRLYLLDSNDPLNSPSDRGITGKLYDDDPETRLLQEIALGVGGWRALAALGEAVEVCHLNEGHAAFAAVERASWLAARAGLSFSEALWATRPGNVFTSHTPVASGFDRFDPALIRKHASCLLADGAAADTLLALGRADAADQREPFNMAWLAMRASGACLAVSRLHEDVSRAIFQPLFPRWPREEVPVAHVTNGVHTPTWDSAEADDLWTRTCGKERWRRDGGAPAGIAEASDEDIWSMRGRSRADLIGHVRRRLTIQLVRRGVEADQAAAISGAVFDPNVLTLGFARRFTDYKRPNLLLRDPERLARILLDEQRPVQIVLAGKAHPADLEGKAMIRDWIALAEQPRLRRRIVFLEDYELGLAQELVQGVDVWLNTPRRPWEACGTSGMKVLVNGGLNASVLDGWWAEAYDPAVGWAIGAGLEGEGSEIDAAEAEETYQLIEQGIAPAFYDRDAAGVPRAWVKRIRASMATLTARFGAGRMIGEYLERAYLPAAAALRERAADGWLPARALADWDQRLRRNWSGLHIGPPSLAGSGDGFRVSAPVALGDLAPEDIGVELYAAPAREGPDIVRLDRVAPMAGAINGFIFAGELRTERPPSDFTVRVVPARAAARSGELPLIAWQR